MAKNRVPAARIKVLSARVSGRRIRLENAPDEGPTVAVAVQSHFVEQQGNIYLFHGPAPKDASHVF